MPDLNRVERLGRPGSLKFSILELNYSRINKILTREASLRIQKCYHGGGISHRICGTSTVKIANPIYPPAHRKLVKLEVDYAGHAARQRRNGDYGEFDLLAGTGRANLRNMGRIFGGDVAGKLHP